MDPRGRHGWRALTVAAAVLAVATLMGVSPPPAAGANGPCPGTTGVTIVVDFHDLGGGIVTRCAPGSPDSGFKALQAVGMTIDQVLNVPGFLCRINGKPADDMCVNTPPATAYWSYWRADRGGSWISNNEGGKTRTPPPGSVDGWSFSSGGKTVPPGIAPPAEPATPKPTAKPTPKPTPKPTAVVRPTPDPPATTRPTTGATTVPTAMTTPSSSTDPSAMPSPSPSPEPAASSLPPAASPSPTVAVVGASDPPSPAPAVAPTASGGLPIGTLIGIGLVVAIAVAGLLAGRRRAPGPGDG